MTCACTFEIRKVWKRPGTSESICYLPFPLFTVSMNPEASFLAKFRNKIPAVNLVGIYRDY